MAITPALKVAKVFGNSVEITNETDYDSANRPDYALIVGVTRPDGDEELYIAENYATAEAIVYSFNADGCYRVALYSIIILTPDVLAVIQPDDIYFAGGEIRQATFGGSELLTSLYDLIPADQKAETYYLADFDARLLVANRLTEYWKSHSLPALQLKNAAEKKLLKARLHYNSSNFANADSTLNSLSDNG